MHITLEQLLAPYQLGIVCSTALVGYDAKNYKIEDSAGRKFVLKHYLESSNFAAVESESKIVQGIGSTLSFKVPLNVLVKGDNIQRYGDQSFSRLIHYIEGKLLTEIKHSNLLLNNFGQAIAELDLALKGVRNPLIEERKNHWDLQYCLINRPKIKHITEPDRCWLVEYYLDQFEKFVLPHLSSLRFSIIHGDLNDWNILTDGNKITGIIDFEDISYAPLVNELAIALSYIMFGKKNPLEAGKSVIQGYHSIYPLTENEIRLLFYLIPARWATSVIHSAEKKAMGNDGDYILINEKLAWELLERWKYLDSAEVHNIFLRAAGY